MNVPYEIGFSTMGTPNMSLESVCELAAATENEIDFLELRGLAGNLDLPMYFQERGYAVPANSPPIRLLASSLCLSRADEKSLSAFYELAKLGRRLGVPYIRVFGVGGADLGDAPTTDKLKSMAAVVETIRRTLAENKCECELLLETHDAFSSSERCAALNDQLKTPVRFLWDSNLTWRLGGETPEETWARLGGLVAHIHYKDSVHTSDNLRGRYVLPGFGSYPGEKLKELLYSKKYAQGLSLEWEKLWHPELPEMSEALDLFIKIFRR